MGHFHGITSLVLFALALAVGLIAVALWSAGAAVIYALLLSAAFLTICGAYCAKCPCRTNACGHVIPGLIARQLPARRQGPYSAIDLTLTVLSLAIMLFYPQPWLWRVPSLLILFWLLTAAAVIEIILRVCRRCRNPHCPMQRWGAHDQVIERR